MAVLIRTCLRDANSGTNPLQPIAQSITTQSWGDAGEFCISKNQNGNLEVVTGSQGRSTRGSVNVHHDEFQGRDGLVEVEIAQTLFEPLAETTTSPAVEQ